MFVALYTFMCLPQAASAEEVYLLTSQVINGQTGNWDPSNGINAHLFSQVGNSTEYTLKVTQMPTDAFYFRIGVKGWGNQMQPYTDNDVLSLTGGKYELKTTEGDQSPFFGSKHAWKVTGYSAYDYLEIHVDITASGTKQVWVVGKKQNSQTNEPTTDQPSYYLVGNFFSPANLGGDINPGGDDTSEINYNRMIFRFEETSDRTYSFDLPAAMTSNMQILHLDEDGTKTAYGPGEEYKLHGTWPKTDGTVSGNLKVQANLSKDNNFWNLYTRNDGTTDDDGMYTVEFKLGANGEPTTWSIKHNPLKMVNYMLSTAYGATAQPIYDTRKATSDLYTQNIKAALHFDGKNSYYVVGYLVYNLDDYSIMSEAKKAYALSGVSGDELHINKLFNNNAGTQNKLFFFGNGGHEFSTDQDHNKVLVNQKPFTLNISGTKVVEFNPNQGNTSLAQKTENCYGMNAEVKIPNPKSVDYPNKIALVGTAIPGTTNTNGSWNWASTAADMTYDANERCYYVTIETSDENQHKEFRFVGDRTQQKNWHEDTETEEAEKAGCEHQNPTGHKCTADDPNLVNYTFNGTTENTSDNRNIMWNRPAGAHTVKLYFVTDEKGNITFKYTITSNEDRKIPFTLLKDKFVRTFSSHQAMDIVNNKVKAYVAYKYVKPGQDEISKEYSCGALYLRQIDYIPADMGVMLIGETPTDGLFSEGDVINYSLRQRTDDVATDLTQIWTKKAYYTNDKWNNYFVPTVEGVPQLGNADSKHEHLYFGLSTFHKTQYYHDNQYTDIEDYIGFFRYKTVSRSGANKAYLSLPTNKTVDNGTGATYGYCDYNGQFIGSNTDEYVDGQPTGQAKMMLVFDDGESLDGTTGIKPMVTPESDNGDNAYYTLQGIRVQTPTKGIYIHNGKKVIIK